MRALALAFLASLALAACKEPAPATDPFALMEGTALWQVTQINGAPLPEGVSVTMGLLKEGLIAGTSGCNRYNGRIASEGGKLHLGELAGTRMMCPAPQMTVEANFHAAMAEARAMGREGNTLILRNEAGAELIRATR